ncbi:uncharacterized protein LOC118646913 [Monomorium pharaonis]|uniref:uncharacterized protein LOC118646913 n=1 Tax=Monomorium pharaonis TaxID=307658 RepID=UPI001747C75A|nr:uncharacterized protein LOC118646913 [Monomorium pharaonis]
MSKNKKEKRPAAGGDASAQATPAAPSTSTTTPGPSGARALTGKCWNCEGTGHYARDWGSRPGGGPTPAPIGPENAVATIQTDYVYNSFGVRDSYLSFLNVEILGHGVRALLDSGSSRTILGAETIDLVKRLGFRFRPAADRRVTTATGQTTRVRGEVEIPFELGNQKRTVRAYALPMVGLSCILGMDFLSAFGMVVNFSAKTWAFGDDPTRQFSLETETTRSLSAALTGGATGGQRTDSENDSRETQREGAVQREEANASLTPDTSQGGLSELSAAESRELAEFLKSEVVGDPKRPGTTSLTEHRIDVGGHAPIKQRYYPVSPKIQQAIYEEVDKMLEAGIIEPSNREWSTPRVMIKKPNGTYRFCLDFRKLNDVSKKDAYPLPYMNSILDKLRAARYISTIDLSQAYFQIPLEKNSKEYTAFTVPGKGLFQFTRMPYGLTGAPATFQRLLDRLIGPEMEPHAFAYLDDIVIVTRTFKEHLHWLGRVFNRIGEAGLTINPDKSKFCRSQVKYLGFLVQHEGLTVDPEKTVAILEYPPPRNIRQLRRFIGMASWYRRFIPQCAGDTQKQAFEVIKSCLVNSPTLSCPDFEKPFVVQTDASSVGLGAVLSQEIGGAEHVIAYASRSLTDAEKKYSTTEQECLAVVWAIRKFRPYLEGYRFTVGAMHHVPDALSRMYEGGEELCAVIATDDQWYVGRAEEVTRNPRQYPDWKLEGDELYVRKTRGIARVVGDRNQWKRVVPRETRREVIRENHDPPHAGHLGVDKTTKVEQDAAAGLMGQRVIESPWTVVAADIMGPLPTSKAGHSYLLVLQDFFTKWVECCPLRKATGKRIREAIEELVIYRWGTPCVLLTDNGTEFVNREIQALTQRCSIHHATVPPYHPQANPVERVNRVLKTMITAFVDGDHREWDAHVHEFRFAYNSTHHTSLQATPAFLNLGREPPPVGLYRDKAAVEVERTEPAEWRERMERLEALQEWVVENLEAAQEKQAKYYNRRHRDRQFEVGEQVLKRHHVLSSGARHFSAKLARKFHGPFVIRRILSPVVYELADLTGGRIGKVHIKDLKPYQEPLDVPLKSGPQVIGVGRRRVSGQKKVGTVSTSCGARAERGMEEFVARWDQLFRRLGEENPGLWTDFEQVARDMRARQYTTRGAVVRELPETCERGTQTEDRPSAERSTQTEGTRTVDAASQTKTTAAEPRHWGAGCWHTCWRRHPSQCP